MGNSIIKATLIDFGIQWTAWIVASLLKTEKFYDLTGSGTCLYLAWQSLLWGSTFYTRQRVLTGFVTAWAGRLGMYLFTRAMKSGDRRFDHVKTRPGVFWIYWTIQAVWILSILLPVLLVNAKKRDKPMTTRDYLGWTIWAVGFVLEATADYQKTCFSSNPQNAGKFIKHGLWSVCQHPNYLGEIMMWSGIYITSSTVLSGFEHVAIISPLLTAFLLTRVSGIPLLAKYGMKKWGGQPDYREYIKHTAKLLPYIW